MRYLPIPFLKSQKQKILLTIKGKSGCEVYAFGKMKFFKPSRIVRGVDTIGAGDYLFADFLINFLKTQDPFISAKIAVENTTKFLLSKIKTYASK
jgi:sugar/nucleoside kinase (ribokinase family)